MTPEEYQEFIDTVMKTQDDLVKTNKELVKTKDQLHEWKKEVESKRDLNDELDWVKLKLSWEENCRDSVEKDLKSALKFMAKDKMDKGIKRIEDILLRMENGRKIREAKPEWVTTEDGLNINIGAMKAAGLTGMEDFLNEN